MELIAVLIVMALIMETVDSSLGMMYGTLLSPILIGQGFEPQVVVPAILISQAIGGISGTVSHHRFENANFRGLTRDTKIVLARIIPGLMVVTVGVFAAVNLPELWVKTYIGILVIVMSTLCLSPIKYKFTWWKHYAIGALAAFNKALTGGGFGPVTSTGGIIGGLEAKVSIATTTFAEVCICSASFIVYLFFVGVDWTFALSLCIGAFIGGIIGPYICSRVSHRGLRKSVGILGIVSGIWLLWRVLL
ncbi:MAG TPA: sulfite exporter TauE/SafE family protein [Methanomicrobia archaeon]|nr:sulfite exporter TauE/SafE family protein [Methanomicrobia archaeon]